MQLHAEVAVVERCIRRAIARVAHHRHHWTSREFEGMDRPHTISGAAHIDESLASSDQHSIAHHVPPDSACIT